MAKLTRIDLGLTRYEEALKLQKRLVSLRHQKKISDCILFTEHFPVITRGRKLSGENLLISADELNKRGIELFDVERGGDITFHGPGQTVIYPIIDLSNHGRDTHAYLRNLENAAILTLKEIGLEAGTKKGFTGVWINDFKVGAIGVAVSRWITFHGIALNVSVNLEYFKLIIPCGINNFFVGSLESLSGKKMDLDYINNTFAEKFSHIFGYQIESIKDISLLITEENVT